MTCLVGVVEKDGTIYMGADSAVSGYNIQSTLAKPKVFKSGKYLISVCGYLRTSQVIEYIFSPPIQDPDDTNDMKHMIFSFAFQLRQCLKSNGISHIQENLEHFYGEALVGYRGKLYTVGSDFSVLSVDQSYMASGSGEEYAYGSLVSTEDKPAKERVNLALKAAAKFSPTVAPPFTVLSMPPQDKKKS